jgi:hypothetical protein
MPGAIDVGEVAAYLNPAFLNRCRLIDGDARLFDEVKRSLAAQGIALWRGADGTLCLSSAEKVDEMIARDRQRRARGGRVLYVSNTAPDDCPAVGVNDTPAGTVYVWSPPALPATPASPAALTRGHVKVLRSLARRGPVTSSIYDLAADPDVEMSRGTIGPLLKDLRELGYAERPAGPRRGDCITPGGQSFLDQLTAGAN